MPRLDGKQALVTGAGTGIGREIALELGRQGADVAVHYFGDTLPGATSAAEEIRVAGRRAEVFPADLRVVDECFALVDAAASWLGGLDILINNAGLSWTKSFIHCTPDDFDDLYHLNIRGQFFCAQRAVAHMSAGGAIINIASVHALASLPGYSIYAGTKGAIYAWTRQVAIELAPKGIRVNAVAPGWIDVPSDHVKFPDIDLDAGGQQIPRRRVGKPLDVARACAYLASDEADYVVGSLLVVDGGTTALLSLSSPEADYEAWE